MALLGAECSVLTVWEFFGLGAVVKHNCDFRNNTLEIEATECDCESDIAPL